MAQVLTLAHSPDPDDVFMWWPLTGKISPGAESILSSPTLDTAPFAFRPIPEDIEILNRRVVDGAIPKGDQYDITALSVRTWGDVSREYIITRCGASFGDGFGPKIVVRGRAEGGIERLASSGARIAVPGFGTTAFLMLGMVMGRAAMGDRSRFVAMAFDQIIPAVARGDVEAGLVIHEGQLTFADAGLSLVLDVGAWWKERTGLKLPLGVNAVRRDLDARYGPGTLAKVGHWLSQSVAYACERREESTKYTMPWAAANAAKAGMEPPTLERVDRYCRMYVSDETLDMGEAGREAIRRLFAEGHAAGLCEEPGEIDLL
ncbi:MAG: MqnA/MqnD/SBP family protein [Planctomycetota bacterium]